ncbi:dethiobiotin synthase [Legionella oakridgensis]|uniref:ATP-dependent dethiobiotin synthetase BioD n=2 Tax=Legionella oakridgensis TaxID=29423 RepID=W0BA42_9GAMM|nr:dethiobiotin synthase [Legionella oakridgensis]AHE67398.1 dethiobiotin synthase [Legionella oakridgensis ATCC 33761 = DSM 21215]ETO92935.1 dethiobiotin synthase [Legionella oakridgensis RV-2-2007]KTD43463.1 dethiobiotin synthetase [Legionella oakridgensis]STY20455.1 Dethiobiotin synthetase [Legionella longbeachae]
MKRYFITGTDTNCGKTYITCQLLHHFQQHCYNAMAVKPVASGCWQEGNERLCEDLLLLQQYNQISEQEICPWRLSLAVSPHLAAMHEQRYLSAQEITDFCYRAGCEDTDYLFIEGAGGLMVPLNNHETWIDFLMLSQIPVILVVGMRLGCLNHALLTESVLKMHNVACAGWIANCLDKDMLMLEDNIETLSQRLHSPLLATVSYGGNLLSHHSFKAL